MNTIGKWKVVPWLLTIIFLTFTFLFPHSTWALNKREVSSLISAAFEVSQTAKGNQLLRDEAQVVKENFEEYIDDHTDSDGDPDRKLKHIIKESKKHDTMDEWEEHLEECKICNPFHRKLLSGTDITPISYYGKGGGGSSGPATICITDLGTCGMAQIGPRGASCYCPSAFGPVWGISD